MRRLAKVFLVFVMLGLAFVAGARWGEPKLFGEERAKKFAVAYDRGMNQGRLAGFDQGRRAGFVAGREAGRDEAVRVDTSRADFYTPEHQRELQTRNQDDQRCHPSYEGKCLDPSRDYDCIEGDGDPPYTGEVRVVGPDEYNLDEDGDGIGCNGQ